MLTKKQKELLDYIHRHVRKDGTAPSFDEMKDALGLKSKSGIHRLVTALVDRGYLERLPHRARAIRILQMPDVNPVPAFSSSEPANSGKGGFIPLYGKIAAGTPIEAIASEQEQIAVPPDMITDGDDYYALSVEGDSMVKAGILDSDVVIIRRTATANNGDIVVALVDQEEATLKRFRRSGNKIILEPENDSYEPLMLEPGRVTIQGRLASLIRTY